jgi:hypothetical protein
LLSTVETRRRWRIFALCKRTSEKNDHEW